MGNAETWARVATPATTAMAPRVRVRVPAPATSRYRDKKGGVWAVGMSAFVPGAREGEGDDGMGTGAEAALIAVRQEAATLRDVLEAIHEALTAATLRLDALDVQLGGAPPAADAQSPEGDGPPRPARTVAEWKLSGWTPTVGAEVVSGETLRARREALGISQSAVAHAAHCSRGLVAEVERGKRRSAQTLDHLSKVLDRLEQQARRN
jgi:hypothetical protein